MKKITIFILFLLPVGLKAQPMNVDSLVNVLNTKKMAVADQLDVSYKICGTYLFYDLDKALEYAEKGLKLAEKEKDNVMCSKFNAIFGRIYNTRASFDSALVYYEKALDFALKSKDKKQEGAVYADVGILYARQDKYTAALDYFMKALTVFENIGEKQTCIAIITNIVSMYRGMDNDEKAIYYLEKAKKMAEETDNDNGKMQVYFQLGAIYHKQAENDKGKVKPALEYELKAYNLSHKLGNKVYQTSTAQALAAIYSDYTEDYDKSLKYAKESLQIAQETEDPKMIIGALSSISNAYRVQKRYKECEEAALKAYEVDSTDINIGIDLLTNITLSNIALGNTEKASLFFEKYNNLIKRHIDQSGREMMADMEVKYETEKKELRIAVLEKEQKLHIGLGVAVALALLSVIGLLFYRHRTVKQKKEIAEQQIKQLEQKQQLIAVQSALKAEKTERELIANDLHDSVSFLLTVVKNNLSLYSDSEHKEVGYYNNAFEVLNKSINELRRVVYHLKSFILTKEGLVAALDDYCRFIPNAKLHFKGINRRFDSDKEYVLYDCACELINNALKHSKASHIGVHLSVDEQTVYLSVADDGIGFNLEEITPGIGLDNIRANLSAYGGHLDILSEAGKGTEANIEMEV